MVSTFTTNVNLEEPARGDQVGTWDTPVNNNMTLADLIVGGNLNVMVGGSNIVLASNQYQQKTLIFVSTLTASITITFPSTFRKSYEIYNAATGAFTITLQTTAAGSQVVCAPPGTTSEVWQDASGNMRFKNFPPVGTYHDYAGTALPAWISGCTVPPYLYCNGAAFSSATYPILTSILGGAVTPDARGRFRATFNDGTGRITTAAGGLDGNTNFSVGGAATITLATSQMPAHAHTVNDPTHSHGTDAGKGAAYAGSGNDGSFVFPQGGTTATINAAATGISINGTGGGGPHANVPPAYILGITMIRAG
jgi:microcystin-dependent protein